METVYDCHFTKIKKNQYNMGSQNNKISVIGIGFIRCGTSYLHRVLNTIKYISKSPSGSHYFSRQFDNINFNYNYNFDLSVTYGYPENIPTVIQNIKEYSKENILNPRLFCIIRDPVERFYSDVIRAVKIGEYSVDESLNNIILHNSSYLLRGKYSLILEEYNKNNLQLEIFKLSDLKNDPYQFWNNFINFCQLDISKNDISKILKFKDSKIIKRNINYKYIRNFIFLKIRNYYNIRCSRILREIKDQKFRTNLDNSLRDYYSREYELYFNI